MTTRADLERLADLMPVSVYLVADDGRFLVANARLRKLLGIPAGDDIGRYSIADYYSDPAARLALIEAVRHGDTLEKRPVTFFVGEREIQLQMFCNSAHDEKGDFLGFFGVLVEVTDENEYHGLFDLHLPTGVYRLDEKDVVTHANLGFAKVHGYHSVEEVKGKNVREFYAKAEEADRIKEQLVREQALHREEVMLRRRNGEIFPAYLTAIPFYNRQQYAGRGGVVEDRTREEQYERLLFDIPVGFYVVERRDSKDIVVDCNEEFARIHDVPSREAMIGRDVRLFHYSDDDTKRLLDQISEAARADGAVLGAQLRIRTALGNVKTLEINSRPQVRDQKIVGRTGAIRDITNEVEMRNTITTLTSDIGAVLHTFRHTLTQLKHSISSVADALAGTPKSRDALRTPEELEEAIRGPLNELTSAVENLVAAMNNAAHAPLDRRDREALIRVAGVMRRYKEDKIPSAHWRDVWRSGAVEIEAICKRIRPDTVARSAYRPVSAAAQKIATITSLATLSVAREAIAAVEAPVVALYESVASGVRPSEQRQLTTLESCVTDAINNVAGFADERKVRILFEPTTRTEAMVARLEIVRAIGNLLHNAIKYSWKHEDGRTWVTVSVAAEQKTTGVVTVENWGVPVPADEIQQDLVFRLGFRGRFSSDRGRMGTGVGLADSLRVARGHGGTLRLESQPASITASPTDYDRPFITRAILELPLAGTSWDKEARR